MFVCFKGGISTGACPGPPLPDEHVRICRRSPNVRVPSAPWQWFRNLDNDFNCLYSSIQIEIGNKFCLSHGPKYWNLGSKRLILAGDIRTRSCRSWVTHTVSVIIFDLSFSVYHFWFIIFDLSFSIHHFQFIIFNLSFLIYHFQFIVLDLSFLINLSFSIYHLQFIIFDVSYLI